MAERRPLGTMLLESGRITRDDVERALEHQRNHGGFFGQALVATGVLRREEMDWALATHFDLPFVFPNADAVDRDAAHLVEPDWALAHLAVPIVRAGRTMTVIVADPLPQELVDELQTRTGYAVEMALASATRIRELIHAIYEAPQADRLADAGVMDLDHLIASALEQGADRFGVSIRGTTALGWWRTRAETRRAPLADGWESVLVDVFDPSPLERIRGAEEGRLDWSAALRRGSAEQPVEVQALVGAGGAELLFQPLQNSSVVGTVADFVLPPNLAAELRLLWRGGAARIGVAAEQAEIARVVLPLLPALVLGEHVRAAHVSVTGEANSAAYTLRAEPGAEFARAVADYGLDAVTLDLPSEGYAVGALLAAAPLGFVLLDESKGLATARQWGVNWLLGIAGHPGSYAWDLRALHG